MFNNLKVKIILIFTIVLLVATAITSWFGSFFFMSEYTGIVKEEVLAVGKGLKLQLDRLLALEIPLSDMMGFEVQCQEVVKKYPDLSFAGVVSPEGTILFQNHLSHNQQTLHIPVLLQAIREQQDRMIPYNDRNQKYFGFTISIVDSQGKHVGAVVLSLPVKVIIRKMWVAVFYSMIISFLVILLSLISIYYFLRRWITNPLKQLMQATHEISAEGPEAFQKVNINSWDEMGKLADSFNIMASELQRTTVSKEYVDNIITNMNDSLIVTDSDGIIRTVNLAVIEILGYAEEELVGKLFSFLFAKEIEALFSTHLSSKINFDMELRNFETTMITKSGVKIPVLLSCSPIKDDLNSVRYIVCTSRDITERKRAEEVLLNQTERLTEINAGLKEFAYVASHGLKEPLRKMIAFGDNLKKNCSDMDEQTLESIDRIRKATIRIQTLINNLLILAEKQREIPKNNEETL